MAEKRTIPEADFLYSIKLIFSSLFQSHPAQKSRNPIV